jgi:hypothetical protein
VVPVVEFVAKAMLPYLAKAVAAEKSPATHVPVIASTRHPHDQQLVANG